MKAGAMTNWILKLLWYSPLVPGTVKDSTYRPVEEELYICLCSGWAIVSDKNFIIMDHLNEMLFDDDYYDWCNVPTCLLYLYYTPASFPEWFSIMGVVHTIQCYLAQKDIPINLLPTYYYFCVAMSETVWWWLGQRSLTDFLLPLFCCSTFYQHYYILLVHSMGNI